MRQTELNASTVIRVAAFTRVAGVGLAGALYMPSLVMAGIFWSLGFALFVSVYFQILTMARVDAAGCRRR